MIIINTDGGSRGNPGPAASAFLVFINDECIYKESYFLGNTTNNMAEYFAVLMALNWIKKNSNKVNENGILLNIDSELVVKQLNGEYKIKNLQLKKVVEKIKFLENSMKANIFYRHVKRSLNKQADGLVNKELDKNSISR